MKKLWITAMATSAIISLQAQQQEGKITYERTIQMQMRLIGMGGDMPRDLPQSRTDKFVVYFGNNQGLKKQLADESPEPTSFENGGIVVRSFAAGTDDVSYCNYAEKRIVDQREFAGKKYIVSDSVRALDWKLTGESKQILGLPCQQAKSQRIGKRMSATMENGEMKRQEVADTMNIVAWFTPAIPVPAGPDFQGQLPGAILEININDGRTVFKAIEVSPKADLAQIREPKSGKKVTPAEFAEEQAKLLKEMQRNNGGRMEFRAVN